MPGIHTIRISHTRCCVWDALTCRDVWSLGHHYLQGLFWCSGNAGGFSLGLIGVQAVYPTELFSASSRHSLCQSVVLKVQNAGLSLRSVPCPSIWLLSCWLPPHFFSFPQQYSSFQTDKLECSQVGNWRSSPAVNAATIQEQNFHSENSELLYAPSYSLPFSYHY